MFLEVLNPSQIYSITSKVHFVKGLANYIKYFLNNLKAGTPKAVKSQAITDLLAQFLGEEEFPLDNEVPGEVASAEVIEV